MTSQLSFFTSVAFSMLAWGVFASRYIWPRLRDRDRADALRPILVLHSFRFMGLAFLVPGVVSPELPATFAQAAAYGDIIAAILALLALMSLPGARGTALAWVFNVWGAVDLFNAFYQAGSHGLQAGQLGATYFIPTFIVPLLFITHGLAFRVLLDSGKRQRLPYSQRAAVL